MDASDLNASYVSNGPKLLRTSPPLIDSQGTNLTYILATISFLLDRPPLLSRHAKYTGGPECLLPRHNATKHR